MESQITTNETSSKSVFKFRDYLKIGFRTYLAQDVFNYGTYMGHCWAYVMWPAYKKLYGKDKQKLINVTLDNTEFFNTNMQVMAFITSLYMAMLDNGETLDEARSIKLSLMGPIGGIGGAISQFGLAMIFASVGASMAAQGLILGPIFFFVCMNLCVFGLKILTTWLGYKLGTNVMAGLKEKMKDITDSVSIVGVTVISGLIVHFTHIKLGLQYSTLVNGKTQVVKIQEILDKILPNMLPVVFATIIFILIHKYKFNMYKLLGIVFGIAIIGSICGILV